MIGVRIKMEKKGVWQIPERRFGCDECSKCS